MIETRAYARAGLLGNPSDGYFGKTIAFSLRNFRARVLLYPSARVEIRPSKADFPIWESLDDMRASTRWRGYYGGIRIIQALEDHGQSCTGLFDVEIEFAHYNYADGEAPFHPYDQIVHGLFRDVQDVFCDFREGFLGNTILSLSVVPVNRRKGGTTDVETALGLQLARNYYQEHYRRYELRQSQLFTFTEATFREKG